MGLSDTGDSPMRRHEPSVEPSDDGAPTGNREETPGDEPGTEIWEPSPAPAPDVPIDMGACWDQLACCEDEEAATAVAKNIAIELASYMLAGRAGGSLDREAERSMKAAGISSDEFVVGSSSDQNGGQQSGFSPEAIAENSADGASPPLVMASSERPAEVTEDSGEDAEKQNCGELLLLNIAKDVQRRLPKQDYAGITLLLSEALQRAEDLREQGKTMAYRVFMESFSMEAIGPTLYTLVEAREVERQPLADATAGFLSAVAQVAKPREVHVMIKLALEQISVSYIAEVSSLVIDDLVGIWAAAIPRIKGTRALFLKDVVESLNRVVFTSASSVSEPEPQEPQDVAGRSVTGMSKADGAVRPNLPTIREKAVLKFVGDLVGQQKKRKKVDALDVSKLPEGHDAEWVPGAAARNALNGSWPDMTEKERKDLVVQMRNAVKEKDSEVHDFETECGYTLVLLLRLVEGVISRMPKGPYNTARKAKEEKAFTEFLRKAVPLFEDLGFLNVVDGLQKCRRLLSLLPVSPTAALPGAVSLPKMRRNRKRDAFFSIKAASCYFACALLALERPEDSQHSIDPKSFFYRLTPATRASALDTFVALQESAFGMLTPAYALELAMPFVMTLVSDPWPYLSVLGTQVLFALTYPLPARSVKQICPLLYTPYEFSFSEADASSFGLCSLLGKSTGMCEVGEDREFKMATLKLLLTKYASPTTKFSVLEILMLQADRIQMSGEFVKQLKDAVIEIDRECDASTSSMYRTRLVETALPRWLLPRKGVLSGIHAAVTASNMVYFIALTDSRKAATLVSNGEVQPLDECLQVALKDRMEFTRNWVRVGLKMMERLLSCANHDLEKAGGLERSKKAKEVVEGKELSQNASMTLVEGSNAIYRLKQALNALGDGLDCFQK